jgi:hypothetical protein
MVGWWPGNGNGLDRAGTNNGQLINGVSFAPGKVDQAFSLSQASQQFIDVFGASYLLNNTQGTIMAWVNPSMVLQYNMVAAFGGGGPGEAVGIGIDTGNVRIYHQSETFDWQTGVPVSTGTWTFLAYTWDGTTERIYKNGSLAGSRARNFAYTPGNGRIGFGFINDPSVFFPGLIDEVAIFDRTLTAADISSIYAAGTAGICPPCAAQPADMIAWWPGDGNAFDIKGPTFEHGIMLNGAGYGQGRVGQAFSFDGVDDHFRASNTTSIAGGTQATYGAWVFPKKVPAVDEYFGLIGVGDSTLPVWSTQQCRLLYWRTFDSPSDQARFYVDCGLDNNENYIARLSARNYPINAWSFVAAVFNNGVLDLYVNGVLDNGILFGTGGSAINSNSEKYVWMGAHIRNSDGSTFVPFEGLIDEAEIYGRALTSAEISAIYDAGSAGKCRPQCYQLPQSVAGWWKGNGDATDAIHGNNGTPVNGAGYAPGMVSQAFSLNESQQQYIGLPASTSNLINNSAGSITSWVNPSTVGGNDIIAAFGSGANGEGVGLGIWGNIRIYHHTGWYDWQTNTPIAANTWTHIAYTWDQTTERIYKNGVFAESRGRNFNYVPGNALIGSGWWGDSANFFPGRIDEVLIFNDTLTAEQIAGMFEADAAGTCTPPVAAVTITGRVMTPEGAGLRNATVTLTDGSGVTRNVTTGSFGYYTFEDVLTGQAYTVGVRSRRYRFTSRQVNVNANVTDFDFVGQE